MAGAVKVSNQMFIILTLTFDLATPCDQNTFTSDFDHKHIASIFTCY